MIKLFTHIYQSHVDFNQHDIKINKLSPFLEQKSNSDLYEFTFTNSNNILLS